MLRYLVFQCFLMLFLLLRERLTQLRVMLLLLRCQRRLQCRTCITIWLQLMSRPLVNKSAEGLDANKSLTSSDSKVPE